MKILGAFILISVLTPPAFGQYIYPSKGQSPEQQNRDRYECHTWAVQQTGFDPTMPHTGPVASSPRAGGQILGGTARGALLGTIGGAIAGNAGRGAAAGAAMGGVFGGMRRMERARAESQLESQQENIMAQQQGSYNRALGVCLQGRGYTVG